MPQPDELARVQKLLGKAREALDEAAFKARRRGANRQFIVAMEDAIRAVVYAEAALDEFLGRGPVAARN